MFTTGIKGQFQYHKITQNLSSEASILRWAPGEFQSIIKIQSHRTGAVKTFQFFAWEVNEETSEVLAAIYKPLEPVAGVNQVIVFNT